MLLCPNCRKSITRLDFEGWVLKVKGSATIDEEGNVESFSPLTSMVTIKSGQELNGMHTISTCPHCKYEGHYKSFIVSRTCWLTGEEADFELSVFGLGGRWVDGRQVELIQHIRRAAELYQNTSFISTAEEIRECVA